LSGPSKAERRAEVILGALTIVGVIILALWARSLLSVIFASIVTVLMSIAFIRSRRISEEEMIRRQDVAIGKPSEDPKEMARWVP
jgi:hypothetical protein